MTSPRQGGRNKPSTWSKGRRDLASPQGINLASALLLCAIVSVILDIVAGRLLNLPKSVVYPAIIVVDLAIFIVAAFKISAMNKRAEKARREVYRQKFEGDMEAIKAKTEALVQSSMKLGEAIYKQDPQAGAPQPDPSGEEPSSDKKEEKVVDAEFEEVDEDKKD